jgi:predicted metal-dependent phosphoesterase TrpH
MSISKDEKRMSELLAGLVDLGLQGIEVWYSEHSDEDRELYLRLARNFNIIPTGGSDYHGVNKPGIHLGTGRDNNLDLPYAVLESLKQ